MNKKNIENNVYYSNIEKYLNDMDNKKINDCPCNVGYINIDKKVLNKNPIVNTTQNYFFPFGFNNIIKNFFNINKKKKNSKKKNIKSYNENRNNDKNTKLKKKYILIMSLIIFIYLKFVKK